MENQAEVQSPSENTPAEQPREPVNNLSNLIRNKWDATFTLGSRIDQGSFVLMEQTFLEYEITIKNMAVFALLGSEQAFEQMENQLENLIRQREALLRNIFKGVLYDVVKKQKELQAAIQNQAAPIAPTEEPIAPLDAA